MFVRKQEFIVTRIKYIFYDQIEDQPDVPDCPDPIEIECGEGIYLVPHPYSCEHFFICANGSSALFDCKRLVLCMHIQDIK